jgi:AcrR family transcriptional regulator
LKEESRRRQVLPASERRSQVIDAVFHVVAQDGISATTIAKVANRAGVGIGTIYRYFEDQRAMLRAAVETLSQQMTQSIFDSFHENPTEHIRLMAETRYRFVSSGGGNVARLWAEFVSAGPSIGLHETIVETQRRAFQAIREICASGIAQGSIRKDVDIDLLAYRIMEQAWGADTAILAGLDEVFVGACATAVLDELLDSISTESPSARA